MSLAAMEARWRKVHQEGSAPQKLPPGAITAAKYAELNGVPKDTAYATLRRMANRGTVQTGIFRVSGSDGSSRPTRVWW